MRAKRAELLFKVPPQTARTIEASCPDDARNNLTLLHVPTEASRNLVRTEMCQCLLHNAQSASKATAVQPRETSALEEIAHKARLLDRNDELIFTATAHDEMYASYHAPMPWQACRDTISECCCVAPLPSKHAVGITTAAGVNRNYTAFKLKSVLHPSCKNCRSTTAYKSARAIIAQNLCTMKRVCNRSHMPAEARFDIRHAISQKQSVRYDRCTDDARASPAHLITPVSREKPSTNKKVATIFWCNG